MADDVRLPTREEIARLPRWARVAFAARCARRVLPLFRHFWPDAPKEQVEAVARAVEFAQQAAARATPPARPAAVAAAAVTHDGTAPAACSAALAAAAAASSTATDDDTAYIHAASAASHARKQLALQAIEDDFRAISDVARNGNWTDDTPVPPTVFGPLWPGGPPPGWPEQPDTDDEIVFEVEVPDGATDDEVLAVVAKLVGDADDLYRAGGGHGLKVAGLEVTADEPAPAPVGGPR